MDNQFAKIVLFLFITVVRWTDIEASCYFPQEFQGDFMMQISASVGNDVQYSTLNITETSIPIWGNCHRRIGNNFILMFNYSETSCIRCLHLKLRSSNVLQVFASSQETISKCYTNEESAETNCPSEESLSTRTTAEILLFKIRDTTGAQTTKNYCPIDGEYYVNYRENAERPGECNGYNSTVGSCPSGSTLNFRLRSCNFDSAEIKFDCLGHWKGPRNEVYLIFMDSRPDKPKYRCALYNLNPVSGKIDMAISRDSTCSTELYNSTHGFETLIFAPKGENPWPPEVSSSFCTFPEWMIGNWEHTRITKDTMVYKDHSSFKTYTIKCVAAVDGGHEYMIFSRSQCNEERYNCLRVAKRGENILEFQLGITSSSTKDVSVVCSEQNFQDDSWITQGRLDIYPEMLPGLCPITGEYTGLIPDAADLCAKLWSDCRAPELMYYQVSHCQSNEVYEEREYQCLGHWRESELLYTYTQRRDVAAGTYECFVGAIYTDKEIFIKEAGQHCQRHINPIDYGMKLVKKHLYSCISRDTTPPQSVNMSESTIPPIPGRTSSGMSTRRTTMRPWNFNDNSITSESNNENKSTATRLGVTTIVYIFVYFLRLYL